MCMKNAKTLSIELDEMQIAKCKFSLTHTVWPGYYFIAGILFWTPGIS